MTTMCIISLITLPPLPLDVLIACSTNWGPHLVNRSRSLKDISEIWRLILARSLTVDGKNIPFLTVDGWRLTVNLIETLTVQYIFLYIWDIAATAESTSGRRFYALFEYVLHYPQGNERTGDIRRVDVTTAAGPILLWLGRATKMAVFWSYFRDFVGEPKIEDLSKSNFFFAEVFQI